MEAEDRAKFESEFNRALDIWHDGDGRSAAEILTRLLSSHPRHPAILGMLGAIYHRMENYERAAVYFRQTVSLSPNSELASLGLFNSLWQVNRHDEAVAEMERFLSVSESDEYDLLIKDMIEDLDS
jgi:predicted Zn-dependent protease